MRAVVCHSLGPLDADAGLALDEWAEPVAGPGQVVMKVEAAGANFVDGLMAEGRYQLRPPVPYVPGGEVAGTVREVGPSVEGVAVGDRVAALTGFGGFAEAVGTGAAAVLAIPGNLDAPRAATMIQGYSTVSYALEHRGRLAAGDSLLVLGGGGGIGLAAVDLGRARGARVLATGSTPEKRAAARAAGADEVLEPTADLKDRVRELTDGGADLVVDPVGGELSETALRSLRTGGRHLVIGFTSGAIPRLALNQVLLRNRSVLGIDWGAWAFSHPDEQRSLALGLLAEAARGDLRPPAPAIEPLERTPQVLAAFLDRRAVGKVAVVP